MKYNYELCKLCPFYLIRLSLKLDWIQYATFDVKRWAWWLISSNLKVPYGKINPGDEIVM